VGCALAGEAQRRARNISAVKNLKRGGMFVAPCREVGSAPRRRFLVRWIGTPILNHPLRGSGDHPIRLKGGDHSKLHAVTAGE